MEQLSNNIASRQVNFKAQTQTQTSPMEAVKNKIENLEDDEKITVGLSALGVMALAALAIAKRPHKATEIVEEIIDEKPIQQAAQTATETVQNVVKNYNKVEVAHTPKAQKQQESISQSVERAIEATKEYVRGGNFGEVRANTTKNLSHDGKKVVQGTLSNIHSAKVAQDISNEHQLANAFVETASSTKAVKNTRQGMKNASREQLIEKLDEAYNSAYQAQVKAQQAQVKAQEIGTKKANKAAFRAEKAAQRAEIEADTARYNAYWRNLELAQEQAQKEASVAEQLASPGFEDGQIKKMLNEDKQAKSALKRQVKRLVDRGHGKVSEKQALEAIVNNSKGNEQVRQLAQERLAQL